MKSPYVFALIVIFSLLIAGCVQQTSNLTAKKEVKVGAILALTGDFSPFGNALRRGIEIAKDEINGKGDIKYNVIFEDDGNVEIRKAFEAGRKLIDIDKVDVSMVTAANEGKSLSAVFESEKTPLIVLFDSNNELANKNYTFGIGFSTEGAARTMAEFAYRNLSVRKISIVYTFDDWSNLIAKSFREEFEKLGGKIILFEGSEAQQKDFRTVIVKSQNADAIYAPLLLPANLIKEARELGYNGSLISGDGFNQQQIDAAGSAAENVYFTNVYVPGSDKLTSLVEKYKTKYNKNPEIVELTAIGYDAMYAVDAAVRAKGIGHEQIKDGLYNISIEGATGHIHFEKTGLSPRFERIFIVDNGTANLIQ